MTEISAQELEARIRRACDWANAEADDAFNHTGEGDDSDLAELAASIRGAALRAVAETLEQILAPPESSSSS
ncbi:hypothetical protein [Streptomyces sp. NPDC058757]|uniref:hypothetical protein n=1 Tax=Streptomyces sp. NPDC058757 TaxID=3346626 RepID=UPI00367FF46D